MVSTQRGTALVRRPGPRLAAGIVTHITRTPVDTALAARQWDGYVAALTAHGWRPVEVPAADECPDAVFVEDALIVCGGTAVVARSGAPERRPEASAAAETVAALVDGIARIEEPGTLDGGDVLQVGSTVYVGRGGRTNEEGIDQLRRALKPLGRTVVAVPVEKVLHLKSAVTALPDGTVLTHGDLVDATVFPARREVPEEAGAHVVPLGGGEVLLAASAPRTADLLAGLGYTPVVVDISEFERLEGCVTCLSVLIPGR